MPTKFVTHAYRCTHPGCNKEFSSREEALAHEDDETRLPAYKIGDVAGYVDNGHITLVKIIKCYPISAHSLTSVKYQVKFIVVDGYEEDGNDVFNTPEDELCDLDGTFRDELIFVPTDDESTKEPELD